MRCTAAVPLPCRWPFARLAAFYSPTTAPYLIGVDPYLPVYSYEYSVARRLLLYRDSTRTRTDYGPCLSPDGRLLVANVIHIVHTAVNSYVVQYTTTSRIQVPYLYCIRRTIVLSTPHFVLVLYSNEYELSIQYAVRLYSVRLYGAPSLLPIATDIPD